MKPLRTLLLALALAAPAWADLAIVGPTDVKPQHLVKLKLTGYAPKSGVTWIVKPADGQDKKELEYVGRRSGECLSFIGPVGRYEVTAIVGALDAAGALALDTVDTVVTIGQPAPPVPPTPPTPPVPPVPPQPPAPIPGDGLRVLIVYDSRSTPGKQDGEILKGKEVRDYLNAKCATEADGKTKAYRIWPSDVDAGGDGKVWADAFARKRDKLPWIVISNGKTGYEGPLPASGADALALLEKYGG